MVCYKDANNHAHLAIIAGAIDDGMGGLEYCFFDPRKASIDVLGSDYLRTYDQLVRYELNDLSGSGPRWTETYFISHA